MNLLQLAAMKFSAKLKGTLSAHYLEGSREEFIHHYLFQLEVKNQGSFVRRAKGKDSFRYECTYRCASEERSGSKKERIRSRVCAARTHFKFVTYGGKAVVLVAETEHAKHVEPQSIEERKMIFFDEKSHLDSSLVVVSSELNDLNETSAHADEANHQHHRHHHHQEQPPQHLKQQQHYVHLSPAHPETAKPTPKEPQPPVHSGHPSNLQTESVIFYSHLDEEEDEKEVLLRELKDVTTFLEENLDKMTPTVVTLIGQLVNQVTQNAVDSTNSSSNSNSLSEQSLRKRKNDDGRKQGKDGDGSGEVHSDDDGDDAGDDDGDVGGDEDSAIGDSNCPSTKRSRFF